MPDSHSIQPRIFIVGNGSLFDEGITQLLTQRTDLLISHILFSDNLAFLTMIKRDQPNVVLICESGSLAREQVIHSISIDPIVIGLCIFVVHLSNPVIDVYEGPILHAEKISYMPRRIIARTENDLINLLKESIR